MHDALTIAGREFGSRLFLGTGKYDTFETMRDAVVASGAEIVTVAVRRIDFDAGHELPGGQLPLCAVVSHRRSFVGGCQRCRRRLFNITLEPTGGLGIVLPGAPAR